MQEPDLWVLCDVIWRVLLCVICQSLGMFVISDLFNVVKISKYIGERVVERLHLLRWVEEVIDRNEEKAIASSQYTARYVATRD